MAEIEDTIADFARVHRKLFSPELPPIAGARAQLKARLAELVIKPHTDSWLWIFRFGTAMRVAAYISATIFTTAVISR